MRKYIVYYEGQIEVEAESAMEAEFDASFDCRPDNCRAERADGKSDNDEDEE
jgi:hypothetical protein